MDLTKPREFKLALINDFAVNHEKYPKELFLQEVTNLVNQTMEYALVGVDSEPPYEDIETTMFETVCHHANSYTLPYEVTEEDNDDHLWLMQTAVVEIVYELYSSLNQWLPKHYCRLTQVTYQHPEIIVTVEEVEETDE